MTSFESPFIHHAPELIVERTKKRLGLARYHVVKDGVVLGFHKEYAPAARLAEFFDCVVVDTK